MSADRICSELAAAMESGGIKVYYQPKYDAITGRLKGAEALARWIMPDGRVISPADFIPAAEETGFITELDLYILRSVCAFLKKRLSNKLRTVPIAVNFSRRHLDDKDFSRKICNIVDSFEVPHEHIEAEITESAIAACPELMVKAVNELRTDGFSVAIDDFGSGLSSLSLVKDISANVLKIDKSLLSKNCENEKERIVLESIFSFAGRLNLTTVAEGVETREQLGFLRTCGCNLIQGFLFARPMPEEQFEEVCSKKMLEGEDADILEAQAPAGAINLLLQAVFEKYPLVIMSNLSRNSFYMMAYESFTARSCPSSGVFSDLIVHGASTMHPDDRELFSTTFSRKNLIAAYERGDKSVKAVTRQIGDDGIYRTVETTDYFVKSPSSKDILTITLCQNL